MNDPETDIRASDAVAARHADGFAEGLAARDLERALRNAHLGVEHARQRGLS